MSTTVTVNHPVLHDYNIHLTGADEIPTTFDPQTNSSSTRSTQVVENPPNWPDNYREVPSYRPINRNLDFAERPGGTSPIERAFIYTMLHGVWLMSSVSRTWRHTGGRVNDKIFQYKIGGEW